MFTAVSRLKYRLSHIRSNTWHWQITTTVWDDKAEGSTCSYYWIKLPVALLAHLIVTVLFFVVISGKLLSVAFAWIIGYRFTGDIMDSDDSVLDSYNYSEYKEKKDRSKMRFAPWEYLLIPIVGVLIWFLGFKEPQIGLYTLIGLGSLVLLSLLVFLLTKGWKNPYIKAARGNVSNAWHRVCPTLIVEEVREQQ